MMVYGQADLQINHQAESWLCWAAVAIAVAQHHNIQVPTQEGLAKNCNRENQAYDPRKALERQFGITSDIAWTYQDPPANPIDKDSRVKDLREVLRSNLSTGPMICQITESRNQKWQINATDPNTKQTVVKDYSFSHAIAVYKYDDASDLVSLADPAQHGSNMKRDIPAEQAVTGFQYGTVDDLGPKAKKILINPPASIEVRVLSLFQHAVKTP